MSLAELLKNTADTRHTALCHEHQIWSYAELDRLTDRLALGLAERGIRASDRVAFLLPNGPELVFIDLACFKLGAVVVPLNPRLKGGELAYILRHSRSRLCIADSRWFGELQTVREQLPEVEAWFSVGTPVAEGTEAFEQLLPERPVTEAWPIFPDPTPAAILYTSGTTALPKGATHSHGSLGAALRDYAEAAGLDGRDVVLGMLSMAHVFGFTLQLLAPLWAGGTVVVAADFAPERVLELIARHKISHLYGLPVMFEALSRHPAAAGTDTGSLRYCLVGGDSATPALCERVRTVLGVPLHEGCGMTEVLPYALNRPPFENRIGSIGRPSVGMTLRLVDELGQEVPEGETGEILVQSAALMLGYWNDPEATGQVLREGWFRTGDMGRRDADGYYWFVGRNKEIIKRAGSKISPLEVESVLSLHPAVQSVAVVGKPDAALGESVAAFVVLKAGAAAGAQELSAYAAERIAAYKVPEVYAFVPELPRGATGKVHRQTLREWATRLPSAAR